MRTRTCMAAVPVPAGALIPSAGPARAHSGWYPAADEKQPAPTFKVRKVSERV